MNRKCAIECIKAYSQQNENFKKNIEALDSYDFGVFLTHGCSLSNLQDIIERSLDATFYKNFGFYTFQYLTENEIIMYFTSRYNVHFDEFIDYVVRHEDEYYNTAKKINQE